MQYKHEASFSASFLHCHDWGGRGSGFSPSSPLLRPLLGCSCTTNEYCAWYLLCIHVGKLSVLTVHDGVGPMRDLHDTRSLA